MLENLLKIVCEYVDALMIPVMHKIIYTQNAIIFPLQNCLYRKSPEGKPFMRNL